MKIKIAIFLLAVCWQTVESNELNTSWSLFLQNLDDYLSSPTIQLNIKKYLVNDLKDWGNCSKTCGVVRLALPHITNILNFINKSYSPQKSQNTIDIRTVIEFLKEVHRYKKTDLMEMLENSRNNFTNVTLKTVETEMLQIQEEALQTGCIEVSSMVSLKGKQDRCIEAYGHGPPHITKKNFKRFLYLLKTENNKTFHNFICWANIELVEKQLKEINSVLSLNLNENLNESCDGNRKIFSGNIVRIGDIPLNSVEKCSKNDSDEEIIQIMASNTIYIDEDIHLKGRMKLLLAVMAPTVVVVGDRKIVLNGKDEDSGEKIPRGFEKRNHTCEELCFVDPNFDYILKRAKQSGLSIKSNMTAVHYYLKEHMEDFPLFSYDKDTLNSPHGVPGLPGQTGGSFFGFANVFANSSQLTISSLGGRGGFGQHGAHGLKGRVGLVKSTCKKKQCEPQNVTWKKEAGKILYQDDDNTKQQLLRQSGKINATLSGTLGSKGSNGGNGGAGGSGGNPGQIRIITSNRNNSFTKFALKGQTGSPGLAGRGGTGGYTPEQSAYVEIYRNGIGYVEISVILYEVQFENGKDGIDGNNTEGIRPPFPAVDITTNLNSLFKDYRTMLKSSLENQFSGKKIFNHLLTILENKEITSNCSASSIVKDLLEYENAFIKLHDKINYTKLYVALMNQTERKVESITDHDEKRALHYTYTAILTKLYAIKNHAEEKYIANLNNFLKMFMEKLGEYKEVKKELAIIEATARYKAELDKQIEDAKNVISNSIQPKLEELFSKIDSEVEDLKKEVDQKEEELLAQRKKLEEQKEAMKKNFIARLFAGILSLVGTIVSFLGPIGMAAGAAISGAGALVMKFGVNQEAYAEPELSDIGAKLGGFTNMFDSEAQQKEILLKDVNDIIDEFTNAKRDFMGVYYTAKDAYDKIKTTANDVMDTYKEINNTYHTVVDDFKTIREELRQYGNLDDKIFKKCKEAYGKVEKKFNGAIKKVEKHFNGAKKVFKNLRKGYQKGKDVFNKVKSAIATVKSTMKTAKKTFDSAKKIFSGVASVATKAISVVEQGGALVSNIMEDRSQMDKINRALAENKENLEKVRQFRKGIDDNLKPMLEGMKNTVRKFPAMCEGKSEAQLMTTGWQVDQALDNILCVIGQMTKEFQVGESFKTTITSIKEAISLMTNIFRKIQDYGDKKKVADHIANVALAGSDIDIKDGPLRADVTNLTVAIQANLLLYDYRVWIKQIKLFVFPLPDTYLQTFKVPMVLQSDDNSLNGYMTNAIKEVKRFRTQYIESNVYISKFDRLKHRAFFYNDTQMGPFYVWKNKDHEKAISRLLAGESVVFEALTMRSGMNALKFRRIDLVIRTNKGNQTLLNDILKNYMVRMKHIGNNYYNCDNITYVATVIGQVFKFSYQYINREPVDINLVYDKILHGDYMLSPYTTWYIKLINVSTTGYKLLLPFQRDVDIELSGEGEYFEDKSEVCEDDLSEYFQTKDQFKKKKEKVYDECPSRTIVRRGFLCCEFNDTFHPKDKEWCRAIVRKPETLAKVHNTSEDQHYYYYDRYFRKSALLAEDLKTKFLANCSLHNGSAECIETFKKRQAYRPWFFYHDKAGGPFSRSYLYCHRGQCLARIQKHKGPLNGLNYTHVNDKYYFYTKLFSESLVQAEDQFKYERCSPSNDDCAPAFENSNLLNFLWDSIPNEF